MATDYMALMKQFEQAFFPEATLDGPPELPDFRTTALRILLIEEEGQEALEALADNNSLEHIAKELADLMVVTFGTAVRYKIPMDEVFRRVHESNMSKLGEDGKPIYNETGKAIKGPNYQPPDLEDLFRERTVKLAVLENND